jgi:peptide/nickel transport system permease protein
MTDAVAVIGSRFSRARYRRAPWLGSPWLWLGVILGGLMTAFVAREWITPYGPADVHAARIMLPLGSPGSPLGTDTYGRDMLSRLIASVPVSVASGVLPATASMGLGTALGLVSGYFGGRVDRLIMSVMDVLLAFPFILLAILAVAILGPSFWNAMIAVAIAILPRNARIIRAETLSLRERDFVVAARLSGAGALAMIVQHMLPNVLPTALVVGSTEIGQMIAATAGLSYLGLGVQQPDVDWGTLIAEGGRLIAVAPALALIPSALVATVSIAFVLAGDDLRHRLAGGESGGSERL